MKLLVLLLTISFIGDITDGGAVPYVKPPIVVGRPYVKPTKNVVLLGKKYYNTKVVRHVKNVNVQVHHRRDVNVHHQVHGRIHTEHMLHTTVRNHWHDRRIRTSNRRQRIRFINARPWIGTPWDRLRGVGPNALNSFLLGGPFLGGVGFGWGGFGAGGIGLNGRGGGWAYNIAPFQNDAYLGSNPWFSAFRGSKLWLKSFAPSHSWKQYKLWKRAGGYFSRSKLWRTYWNREHPKYKNIWKSSLWPSYKWGGYKSWIKNGGGFANKRYWRYFDTHMNAWPKPKWLSSWTPKRSWKYWGQWKKSGRRWDTRLYQTWWRGHKSVWPKRLDRSWIFRRGYGKYY